MFASRLPWLTSQGLNDFRPTAPRRFSPSNCVKATAVPATVVAETGPSDVVMHHAARQIDGHRKEPPRVLRLLSEANEHGHYFGLASTP